PAAPTLSLHDALPISLAHEFKPDAIVLDLQLPVMDGSTVLDHLKHDPETRHIPVHVITGTDDGRQSILRAGAVAFLKKPLEKEQDRKSTRLNSSHDQI